jgi:LAO/AO transport system kinase
MTHPLLSDLLAGQRRALAKAITLAESTRRDHQQQAQTLLTAIMPHTGRGIRLGISGVPGVGKSTFIEALGMTLIGQGHRVAVLAVDPSSSVTGGSILGDKTRMEQLAARTEAFIRPSPASGSLGGVAEKTREALLLCEAAGYDIVIVETVGVGQSEIAVASMCDLFVLLQLPNAGDDLQAIKKGIMELADMVLINKADIDLIAAQRAAQQMRSALAMVRSPQALWQPTVQTLSALAKSGIEDFWQSVLTFRSTMHSNGAWEKRRARQAVDWMWSQIDNGLRHAFRHDPQVQAQLPALASAVEAGKVPPTVAARTLLALMQPTPFTRVTGDTDHA